MDRRLAERHFPEKVLSRMPFHVNYSAVLYYLCYIIIATYYRKHSASVTGRMTECFLLLRCDATWKSSVLSPPKHLVSCLVFGPDQDVHKSHSKSPDWNSFRTNLIYSDSFRNLYRTHSSQSKTSFNSSLMQID